MSQQRFPHPQIIHPPSLALPNERPIAENAGTHQDRLAKGSFFIITKGLLNGILWGCFIALKELALFTPLRNALDF